MAAITLRKAGFDARYMAGGHNAWKAVKMFDPSALARAVVLVTRLRRGTA